MKHPIKIIEIEIHRSKRNPRLGHAVALLFPCNHHRYLGWTLYKGEEGSISYRQQDVRVIKFDDYSVLDKVACKLCPPDDFFIDDLPSGVTVDDFVDVLESLDDF